MLVIVPPRKLGHRAAAATTTLERGIPAHHNVSEKARPNSCGRFVVPKCESMHPAATAMCRRPDMPTSRGGHGGQHRSRDVYLPIASRIYRYDGKPAAAGLASSLGVAFRGSRRHRSAARLQPDACAARAARFRRHHRHPGGALAGPAADRDRRDRFERRRLARQPGSLWQAARQPRRIRGTDAAAQRPITPEPT
jgi:hypothetical protein